MFMQRAYRVKGGMAISVSNNSRFSLPTAAACALQHLHPECLAVQEILSLSCFCISTQSETSLWKHSWLLPCLNKLLLNTHLKYNLWEPFTDILVGCQWSQLSFCIIIMPCIPMVYLHHKEGAEMWSLSVVLASADTRPSQGLSSGEVFHVFWAEGGLSCSDSLIF